MPTTDAGVLAQVVGTIVVGIGLAIAARGRREVHTLILGAAVLTLALISLRILH